MEVNEIKTSADVLAELNKLIGDAPKPTNGVLLLPEGMTREEFSERSGIPLENLHDISYEDAKVMYGIG